MNNTTILSLIVLVCGIAFGQAEQRLPNGCTTPILLTPVIETVRRLTFKEGDQTIYENQTCLPYKLTFVQTTRPLAVSQGYDKIIDVAYDAPKETFALFVKDRLVQKLIHTDASGKQTTYLQDILDELDKVHFEDKEYTKLSKDCLRKLYEGECPFLRLPNGRQSAVFNLILSNREIDANSSLGYVTFSNLTHSYGFDIIKNQLSFAYMNMDPWGKAKNKNDTLIYSINFQEKHKVSGGAVYDLENLNGFNAQFFEDMGLCFYSPKVKGKISYVREWETSGGKSKKYSDKEYTKMVMSILLDKD